MFFASLLRLIYSRSVVESDIKLLQTTCSSSSSSRIALFCWLFGSFLCVWSSFMIKLNTTDGNPCNHESDLRSMYCPLSPISLQARRKVWKSRRGQLVMWSVYSATPVWNRINKSVKICGVDRPLWPHGSVFRRPWFTEIPALPVSVGCTTKSVSQPGGTFGDGGELFIPFLTEFSSFTFVWPNRFA